MTNKASKGIQALQTARKGVTKIEVELLDLLDGMTVQQRKYVEGVIDGLTKAKAYEKAGYSMKTHVPGIINRLAKNTNITEAIKIGSIVRQLKYGVSIYYKRDKTLELIETTSDKESEHFNASSSIQALKYLSDLDGDIVKHTASNQGSAAIKIVIQTGIPGRDGTTGQVIEHDDTNNVDSMRQPVQVIDNVE